MNDQTLPPYDDEGVRIDCALEGTTMCVTIVGSVTSFAPDALRAYLMRLHEACMQKQVQQATVDLRELEFMNSGGFSSFVDWLVTLQNEPAAKRYRVVYRSSNRHAWQRRSLQALQCLAIDLVSVESK